MLGRELGWRLRAVMRAADLTGQQMAERLEVSPSLTSRMLSGHRGSDPAEVATFLAVCGVAGTRRERILALCRQEHTPGLLRLEGAERWVSLREHASQAREIAEFAPIMLPWGMQTPAYTCAVADAMGVASDVAGAWGGFRVRLVDLTDRSHIGMWSVVLHEWVLRTAVGGHQVMAEQLHRLLRLSVHPAVSLRVLPASVGEHASMAGAFMVLDFGELPALVYREDADSGVFLEAYRAVDQARGSMAKLRRAALDAVASRALIRQLAVELYGVPEPLDDLAQRGGAA